MLTPKNICCLNGEYNMYLSEKGFNTWNSIIAFSDLKKSNESIL
jgi:cell fate regulator YaaT (PSP1 superfamily)